MPATATPPPCRPITTRAAENGLYLGLCIGVLMTMCGVMVYFPMASLFVWAGSLAMPFILYRMLSGSNRECGGRLSFAEVWAEGIASFFLGSLIPAAAAYLLLRYAFPDLIRLQMQTSIDALANIDSPWAHQYHTALEQMQAKMLVPGPADIAANIISFNIVAGTLLSLMVAPFVKFRKPRTNN